MYGMGFLPVPGYGNGNLWSDWPVITFPNPRDGWGDYAPDMPVYGPESAPVPGYCPRGYYHPINDPYSCVAFPDANTGGQGIAPPMRPQPQQGTTRPIPQNGQCPPPFVFDPKTKKCQVPPCPPGQGYSLTARKCVPAADLTAADQITEPFPWLWVAIGSVALLVLSQRRGR